MASSPDSSSDSSTGSPHNMYDGPNIEAENCLPGVVGIWYSVCVCVLCPCCAYMCVRGVHIPVKLTAIYTIVLTALTFVSNIFWW